MCGDLCREWDEEGSEEVVDTTVVVSYLTVLKFQTIVVFFLLLI